MTRSLDKDALLAWLREQLPIAGRYRDDPGYLVSELIEAVNGGDFALAPTAEREAERRVVEAACDVVLSADALLKAQDEKDGAMLVSAGNMNKAATMRMVQAVRAYEDRNG